MQLVALGFGESKSVEREAPVQTTAMNSYAALGTQLGHLAGDVIHGLSW